MHTILKMVPAIIAGAALAIPAGAETAPAKKARLNENVYTATVKAPTRAPETWTDLGTGRLRDDLLTYWYNLADYYEFDVKVQASDQTPGRYRLVNAYRNFPITWSGNYDGERYIIVDATDPDHCYIEAGSTGLQIESQTTDENGNVIWSGDADFCIWSIAENEYNNVYGDWDAVEKNVGEVAGTLKNGAITFPRNSLVICLIEESEAGDIIGGNFAWRQANADGMFRFSLPGAPELDAVITFGGIDDAMTTLSYHVALDKDVEKARVALIEGDYTPAVAAGIADGSIPSQEITATADLNFPFEKDGIHTLVVVPYYEGQPATPFHLTTEYAYSEAEWRKCGTATYTESILASNEMTTQGYWAMSPYTYEVEVEESVAKPGLLRLVDPYGLNYPYATSSNFDTSRRWYLEIDCQDPERVFIPKAENGVGLDLGLGTMVIWSRADRQITEYGVGYGEVDGMNIFGKVSGSEVTFPKDALYISFPDRNPGTWYWANQDGTFKLVLPEGAITPHDPVPPTSVEGIDADQAPARYYTVDGIELSAEPTRGLYIRRQGSKVTKIAR